MGTGPWWVPSSSHGKAKFVTRSNALLMAAIAGLVGAVFGASSSGSLFGHEIKLSSVAHQLKDHQGRLQTLPNAYSHLLYQSLHGVHPVVEQVPDLLLIALDIS